MSHEPEPARAPDQDRLADALAHLYKRQLLSHPVTEYLAQHARDRVVQTQVRVFRWYARFLPTQGDFLDWGCHHAPDSCLLRAAFGPGPRLSGCDFVDPERLRVFHDFAGLRYTPLSDPSRLPYADASFDAVVGSGALEHAVMDYESLKELYRVLRPDGVLVITYLPNRLSVEEWHARAVRRSVFHRRLYSLHDARQLLLHTGFVPLQSGYQTRMDVLREPAGWAGRLRVGLMRALQLHRITSTVCAVARKERFI
jgi:SAM-dependent methyltransferase